MADHGLVHRAFDENLAGPFETNVLGVPVTVERVDLDRSDQIVAISRRARDRQALPILVAETARAQLGERLERFLDALETAGIGPRDGSRSREFLV